MLNLSAVSVNLNLGPSVVGTASLVGPDSAAASPPKLHSLSVPWQQLQNSPSVLALLSWHGQCSEFRGRESQLEVLEAWASCDIPVSVKLVVGDGGTGKSRLAAEFATSIAEHGWSAGFVNLRKSIQFPLNEAGTLLVIDYPEQQPREVRELLRDLAALGQPPSKMRVLLLSRRPVDYWQQIIHDTRTDILFDSSPLNLGPLDTDESYRLYLSTLGRVAELHGTTPLAVPFDAFCDWLAERNIAEHSLSSRWLSMGR